MSLVNGFANGSQLISKTADPAGSGSYGGWIDSWGTEVYDQPSDGELTVSMNFIFSSAYFYSGYQNIYLRITRSAMSQSGNGLDYMLGRLGYVVHNSNKYACFVYQFDATYVYVQMLEYDTTWLSGSTVSGFGSLVIPGYCSLKDIFESDLFSAVGSSAGLGSDSKMAITINYGEYNDLPGIVLNDHIELTGRCLDDQLPFLNILNGDNNYPTLYFGDKADLHLTAYERFIKVNSYNKLRNLAMYFNCSGSNNALSVAVSNVASIGCEVDNLVVYNHNFTRGGQAGRPLFCSYTNVFNHEFTGTEAGVNSNNHRYEGAMVGFISSAFPSDGIDIGFLFHYENVVAWTGDHAFFANTFSRPGVGVIRNMTAVTNPEWSKFDVANNSVLYISPVVEDHLIRIDTMLAVDFNKILDDVSLSVPGRVRIGKLAVQNVNDLNLDYIEVGELVVIPNGEQVFADKENGDFTIVHPTLIENKIGVFPGVPYGEPNNLAYGYKNIAYGRAGARYI